MTSEFLQPRDGSLLAGVRGTLTNVDEAILCVAFVRDVGVRLIEKELRALSLARRRVRLLATTAFDSAESALGLAASCGVDVRVLNPGGGSTYHPKVYLGRRGDELEAVVGSANLTSGLVNNVEAAVRDRGGLGNTATGGAWAFAEALWDDPASTPWASVDARKGVEPIDDRLLARLRSTHVFYTVSDRRPNRVATVTSHEVFVSTRRTEERGQGPQSIPAWMFNLALETLRTRGRLTNAELLNDLRVHRSSAVCALLATLPDVRVVSRRPIELEWAPAPAGDG